MNPVEKVLRRADAAQQQHQPTAFLFGVVKKFGDDNGSVLVTNLAYAAFVSMFPLLLILVTVLVNIAAIDPSMRNAVISGATTQFPLIGRQLASNIHVLRRSTAASLTVGLLLLVWGVSRLAQAGLFTMEQVWNLPGPARPGYLPRLGRSAEFLGVLTLGVVISTLLAGLVTYGRHALAFRMLAQLLAELANIALYLVGFRVLTPKGVRLRQLLPGAIAGGTFWTLLQASAPTWCTTTCTAIRSTGFSPPCSAWWPGSISATGTVYAAEINVVLARRLWPRAIVQPPLTEADRASMALQALQNQRRPEQQVQVTFNDRPDGTVTPIGTPQTPADVAPPASFNHPSAQARRR